ncbi:MAG: hypothetical protein EXQ94_03460 [Alphaproteobacteria bacterium]|nr:hypothetical protein [Alphaproteobacteria bacterium]
MPASHAVRSRFFCLTAAFVLAFQTPIGVAAENSSWEVNLRDQMGYDYDCEIDHLSEVELRLVEGVQSVLAKVHCKDSRVYKATRLTDYDDFIVAPCESAEGGC